MGQHGEGSGWMEMDKARWKEEETCDVCVQVEEPVGAYIRRGGLGGQEARGKKLYNFFIFRKKI
jgi:hypothetical protein